MRIVLPVRPQAASRPRVVAGHAYYPERYRSWLEVAAAEARRVWRRKPAGGPVHVSVFLEGQRILVDVDEQTAWRRGQIRGDLDNHVKAVLDALVAGGVLVDDRQVEGLVAVFAGQTGAGSGMA